MKRAKLLIFISAFIVIGSIGSLITMYSADKLNADNTQTFSATVRSVEHNYESASIYTEEFGAELLIDGSVYPTVSDKLNSLKAGERITFAVEDYKCGNLNDGPLVGIASLSTDSKELLTLDEYNACNKESLLPARIAGAALAAVFFVIGLCAIKKVSK